MFTTCVSLLDMYDCCKMNLSRTHMYVQIYVILVNKMILAWLHTA